jgi:hypothetical protein
MVAEGSSKDPTSYGETGADNHPGAFRIVHDPSPHPLSPEVTLSRSEVQFRLRFNRFFDQTEIEDLATGQRYTVTVNKIFQPTNNGGMLAYLQSELIPPHPQIKTQAYDDSGRYIGG